MNILSILSKVGAGLFSAAVPGGAAILNTVNSFLPEDKKLPVSATGAQVQTAISGLSPDAQASLLSKEFDVDITQIKEDGSTLRAMLQSEQASPHTTRPKIALRAFNVVGIVTLLVVVMWCYAVATANDVMVKTIVDGWPWLVGLLAPFVMLLRAYFGVLAKEQKNRLDAANGSTGNAVSGIIGKLINK